MTYRLSYIETGMMFVGWDSYDGEHFDEDCAEHSNDADRYWEMAAEEFGMEPDEVLRLQQVTGLSGLFSDSEFSEAWEAETFEEVEGVDE